ncbi:hypothetical protein [Kocuria sp.]|uniref:hypothetical protein n=1 Tax=Kocuria sp. TaxID=1871328 RepID=UPI0026E0D6BF|nr:hypothetical protein [Kocuria sp.]MDO5618803.1 hypothetical protein [Kocuria sp.]
MPITYKYWLAIIISGVLLLSGIGGMILMFFQPWASCEYGDVPAECALSPTAAMVQAIFALTALAGCVALLITNWKLSQVKTR